MEPLGNNLYRETLASGQPIVGVAGDVGFGKIQQGYLEAFNVDPVKEITELIAAQRSYEMNSKVIRGRRRNVEDRLHRHPLTARAVSSIKDTRAAMRTILAALAVLAGLATMPPPRRARPASASPRVSPRRKPRRPPRAARLPAPSAQAPAISGACSIVLPVPAGSRSIPATPSATPCWWIAPIRSARPTAWRWPPRVRRSSAGGPPRPSRPARRSRSTPMPIRRCLARAPSPRRPAGRRPHHLRLRHGDGRRLCGQIVRLKNLDSGLSSPALGCSPTARCG